MSRWFRFYAEAIDDPKVQRLPPHLFKAWVNLLCLAANNEGLMPPLDDVSFRTRMSPHDAQNCIDELIGIGLLDIVRDGRIEPHNWRVRQFISDTSTDRVRRFRKGRNVSCNVSRNGADETRRNANETLVRSRMLADNPTEENEKFACNVSETVPESETESEHRRKTPLAPQGASARSRFRNRKSEAYAAAYQAIAELEAKT